MQKNITKNYSRDLSKKKQNTALHTPAHPVSTPGCGRQAEWEAADSGCYESVCGAADRAEIRKKK